VIPRRPDASGPSRRHTHGWVGPSRQRRHREHIIIKPRTSKASHDETNRARSQTRTAPFSLCAWMTEQKKKGPRVSTEPFPTAYRLLDVAELTDDIDARGHIANASTWRTTPTAMTAHRCTREGRRWDLASGPTRTCTYTSAWSAVGQCTPVALPAKRQMFRARSCLGSRTLTRANGSTAVLLRDVSNCAERRDRPRRFVARSPRRVSTSSFVAASVATVGPKVLIAVHQLHRKPGVRAECRGSRRFALPPAWTDSPSR
jgi:hypothetical protein